MIDVGQKLPDALFIGREGDALPGENLGGCPIGGEFVTKNIDEVFKGKRVVVFGLPGAFTPTCSSQQLPGFDHWYRTIRSLNVDEVYCLSVNDGFVMNAWFAQDGIENVKPLCDGNAEFVTNCGLITSMANVGFGVRSRRFAMVVNDGTVEWLAVEDRGSAANPDPYEQTRPEDVLTYLEK